MDSPASGYSWHNDALLQNGNSSLMTCDWRVRAFTNAGVVPGKIGVGIPFYGRRWSGVTQPLVTGNFSAATVLYRDLVGDSTRWQPQHKFYESGHKGNYLSIPGLNEFVSYNGVESIQDAVAWQRSNGFGGFMTFTVDYEYVPTQSGDARYPLSTALYSQVFPPLATRSQLTAPAPGSILAGASVTFTWTTVASADGYWLDVGNAAGQGDAHWWSLAVTVRLHDGRQCKLRRADPSSDHQPVARFHVYRHDRHVHLDADRCRGRVQVGRRERDRAERCLFPDSQRCFAGSE
jgi:hypothetical protein